MLLVLGGDAVLHASALPGFAPNPCPAHLLNPGKSDMTYNVAEAVSTLRKVQDLDADVSSTT